MLTEFGGISCLLVPGDTCMAFGKGCVWLFILFYAKYDYSL